MSDIYESGEDYLEAIYVLDSRQSIVKSVDVAKYLGVSKPSVFRALSNLESMGYISKENYGDIKITTDGKARAKEILLKHNALKTFLIEVLGVSEDNAEKDACKIEHDLSDETKDKLLEYLKNNGIEYATE